MGRLRDIADSIKAAIDSLKDAIRSKGVEVEDSAKASELPALIASMNTGKESRVSFTLITHEGDVVPACIVDSPAPLEGLFSFHHSGDSANGLYPPVKLDSISIPPGSVKGESADRMFYVDGVNAEGTDWTTQALYNHGITIESYQAEVAVTADEIFASAYYISSAIYANFGPLGDWITRAYKAFYNRYAIDATVIGPNGLTESRFMFLGFGGDELLIRCSFLHVEPGNAKYTFAYWIEGLGFRRINISSSIECEDASGMFMNCTFESSDETLSSPVSSSNNVLHIVNLESEFYGVWTETEHFMERADHMFADCRVLQNVSLGSGFPNLESAEYMFRGCDILECVLFPKAPNLSLRHVFSLGGMTEIYVNDGAFTDATSAEGAFEECTRLETLNLPVGFCSNVTDASLMFSKCTSLTTIKRNDGGEVYAGGGDGILCLQVSCDLSDTALDHDSVVRVLRSLRDPLDGAATLELGALMGKLWTAQDADDLHLPTTRGWTITGTGTHALPEDGDLDAFYSGTMSEAGADDSLTIATCFNGIGMGTVDESSTILEEVNSFYEMAF